MPNARALRYSRGGEIGGELDFNFMIKTQNFQRDRARDTRRLQISSVNISDKPEAIAA